MQVTGIEISDYHYCRDSARHMASVGLTLKDRFVTLFCQLELPENAPPGARARAFAGDALRQMLRMPEFRSGRKTLEVAEDMLAGAAPEPA